MKKNCKYRVVDKRHTNNAKYCKTLIGAIIWKKLNVKKQFKTDFIIQRGY